MEPLDFLLHLRPHQLHRFLYHHHRDHSVGCGLRCCCWHNRCKRRWWVQTWVQSHAKPWVIDKHGRGESWDDWWPESLHCEPLHRNPNKGWLDLIHRTTLRDSCTARTSSSQTLKSPLSLVMSREPRYTIYCVVAIFFSKKFK